MDLKRVRSDTFVLLPEQLQVIAQFIACPQELLRYIRALPRSSWTKPIASYYQLATSFCHEIPSSWPKIELRRLPQNEMLVNILRHALVFFPNIVVAHVMERWQLFECLPLCSAVHLQDMTSVTELATICSRWRQLVTSLDFHVYCTESAKTEIKQLCEILPKFSRLEGLSIMWHHDQLLTDLQHVLKAIAHCERVKNLHIGRPYAFNKSSSIPAFPQICLPPLLECIGNKIESLSLTCVDVPTSALRTLGMAICKAEKLTALRMDTCKCIADAFLKCQPRYLEKLELIDCIQSHNGFFQLGRILKEMPNLQELYVSSIFHEVNADLKSVLYSLQHLRKLHTLRLAFKTIGVDAIGTLAVTQPRLNLKTISLQGVGEYGICRLAMAFTQTIFLTSLELTANDIGNIGAREIARCLTMYPMLCHLDLSFNEIGNDGAAALADAIAETPQLEMLDIHCNPIQFAGIKALLNRMASPDVASFFVLDIRSTKLKEPEKAKFIKAIPHLKDRIIHI